MDLTPYIRSLREDLLAAAAIGDEDIRRAATVLGAAIEPSARLAIMNALSDFAAEVTGALEDITVDLRLDARDVKVTVTRHEEPATEFAGDPGAEPGQYKEFHRESHLDPRGEDFRRAMQDAGGELSRTTVRLFNDLKSQAEQAASTQGVSLNTYISRAVSDSLRSAVPNGHRGPRDGKRGGPGRTVTGFIQA